MYNTKGVSEDLGDTNVYQQLSEKEAVERANILSYRSREFIGKWKEVISPAEHIFLNEAMIKQKGKIEKFHMSLKAHKTPYKMCSIVCCSGILINCLS